MTDRMRHLPCGQAVNSNIFTHISRMLISYNLQCVFLFAIIFTTVQDESVSKRNESAAYRETARKSGRAGSGKRERIDRLRRDESTDSY